jgi:hypothetical protein
MMLFATGLMTSQNLTVGDFLKLSKKSLGEIQEELTAKNWHFYQGVDETEEVFGNVKFVFDRPGFKVGDAAQYFVVYYYSEDEGANAVEISFRTQQIYDSYTTQLKNLKFELVSSKTDNGNIIKVYKYGGMIAEITIPPNFDRGNSYKFMFAKKSDYKKIRSN